MLVKMRIPHETKLPGVIQVPYSSTFVKITAVHVRITFDGTLDSHKYSIEVYKSVSNRKAKCSTVLFPKVKKTHETSPNFWDP